MWVCVGEWVCGCVHVCVFVPVIKLLPSERAFNAEIHETSIRALLNITGVDRWTHKGFVVREVEYNLTHTDRHTCESAVWHMSHSSHTQSQSHM